MLGVIDPTKFSLGRNWNYSLIFRKHDCSIRFWVEYISIEISRGIYRILLKKNSCRYYKFVEDFKSKDKPFGSYKYLWRALLELQSKAISIREFYVKIFLPHKILFLASTKFIYPYKNSLIKIWGTPSLLNAPRKFLETCRDSKWPAFWDWDHTKCQFLSGFLFFCFLTRLYIIIFL